MESRDLLFDQSDDEIALHEAIAHGGGADVLDPLARDLGTARRIVARGQDVDRDVWVDAQTTALWLLIRGEGGEPCATSTEAGHAADADPDDVIIIESATGWGGRRVRPSR